MRFQTPLVPATLIRRYKRFLSDVRLDTGEDVVAHCPNPGSMMGMVDPGMRVWVEPNDDPKKKLKYGWRVTELNDGTMVGIDTAVPNRVVKEALLAGKIAEVAEYKTIRPEQNYGTNSRIDFLCQQDGLPDVYVEVKNVNLMREGDWAEFPDCVTARGTKHLHELRHVVQAGHRAIMLYLVQHTGSARFKVAGDIDPEYAAAFSQAQSGGVEVACYTCDVNLNEIVVDRALPVFTG